MILLASKTPISRTKHKTEAWFFCVDISSQYVLQQYQTVLITSFITSYRNGEQLLPRNCLSVSNGLLSSLVDEIAFRLSAAILLTLVSRQPLLPHTQKKKNPSVLCLIHVSICYREDKNCIYTCVLVEEKIVYNRGKMIKQLKKFRIMGLRLLARKDYSSNVLQRSWWTSQPVLAIVATECALINNREQAQRLPSLSSAYCNA